MEKINYTSKFYPIKPSTYTHTTTIMQYLNTPDSELHNMQKHYFTLIKVKIQDIVEFCKGIDFLYYKKYIFSVFNMKKCQKSLFMKAKVMFHKILLIKKWLQCLIGFKQ